MSSKQLGAMVEGNSTDNCPGKCPLMSMGGLVGVSREQTRERGPPSASAEIYYFRLLHNVSGRICGEFPCLGGL